MENVIATDAVQECSKRKPFWKNPRGIALFVAFVLIFSCIGGYTVAYLQMKAEKDVRNDFRLAEVAVSECYTEREDGATDGKNDVYFKNVGTVSAYIRVAVIANWVNKENSKEIYGGKQPTRGTDYRIDDTTGSADSAWFKIEQNGVIYYYHKSPVSPNGKTEILFDIYELTGAQPPTTDYKFDANFAVQAVQAVGEGPDEDGNDTKVVILAWGDDITIKTENNVDYLAPKGS